jgi:hypothetical protein
MSCFTKATGGVLMKDAGTDHETIRDGGVTSSRVEFRVD